MELKSDKKKKVVVKIPEGRFCGNCSDCIYADPYDKDSYGRIKCNGPYGGYNKPGDRNGCFHYKR